MRLDQEFLADRAAALRLGAEGNEDAARVCYASELVALATGARAENLAPGPQRARPEAPARSESRSGLCARIAMLVQGSFPFESRPSSFWRGTLYAGSLLGVLAISALSVRGWDRAADVGRSTALPRCFRIQNLTLHPPQPSSPPSVDLPLLLPDHYDLRLELRTEAQTSPDVVVAGFHVRTSRKSADSPTWHLVRLRREDAVVSVWVDGQLIPSVPVEPLPPCLRFRACATQDTRIRNLVLSW